MGFLCLYIYIRASQLMKGLKKIYSMVQLEKDHKTVCEKS